MGRKRRLPQGIRERNGVYYADIYANGRRVRKRLSTQLDVATQLLHELQARADRADFGLLDNDVPLIELKEKYLLHCRQVLRPGTVARYEFCLASIFLRLSASRATQVTHALARVYRADRLAEGIKPRTVNMEVTVLGSMLRWAVAEGMIGSNPLAGLKALPDEHRKAGRALTDDEVRRLLEASPPLWRDIWYTLLVTGLRRGELAALTFRDIDWEARELVVRGGVAKNHRERRVPIDSGLWDILKRQEAGRESRQPGKGRTRRIRAAISARFSREHVFVSPLGVPLINDSVTLRPFLSCCEKAKVQVKTLDAEGRVVEHVDVHSLRRTFATNLIANGADPKTVQELMGHATLDMTMRIYTKIHKDTKRQAMGKLSYGQGALAPAYVVEYPGVSAGQPKQAPVGPRLVTSEVEKKAE
jgi:integrase